MKKVLFSIFFLGALLISKAQQTNKVTFVIKNNNHPENTAFFEMSVVKSNLDQYRLKDERLTIKCDNGFDLELLSANELKQSGYDIEPSNYQLKAKKTFYLHSFKIAEGGQIVLKHKEYFKGIDQ